MSITTKEKNAEVVKALREKIEKAKSITFTNYTGLSVDSVNELRQKVKETGGEVLVAKNTLLKVALKEQKVDVEPLTKDLEGPTAVVLSYKDPISSIKAVFDFIKKVELPKIKSAIIEGVYNTSSQVDVIKTLPSREQLIAQTVGGFKAPLRGVTTALGGLRNKFVYVVKAIADKQQA